MIRALKYHLFIGLVCCAQVLASQQRYPVQVTFRVQPPYTTVFADYVSTINNKLQGSVTLNDLSEPSRDIRLKLEIEGQGIRMVTNGNFAPQRITLLPGVPVMIDIRQLQNYLSPSNLDFFGIGRQQFVTDGRFSEGLYQFSLTAIDYNTGKALSLPSTAMVWLRLNDEPTAIAPKCGSVIPLSGPQNIFFQWQLNSPVNVGVPFVPNYQFYLYEIMERETDPMYALNNGNTILVYESDPLMVTNLNYNLAMPTLDPGKRYLYRIRAFDPTGNNEFRNDGFSPPCYIHYGYPQGGAITTISPEDGYKMKAKDPRILEWEAPDNLLDDQRYSYKLHMVELEDPEDIPEVDDFELMMPWLETTTPPVSGNGDFAYEISKKMPNDQYFAWYVSAHTGQQIIAQSEVQSFRSPSLFGSLKAGNHTVYINELKDNALDNLTGSGFVKIYETDTDSTLTEVIFEGLEVEKVAGRYVLENGEIRSEIAEDLEFELNPREELNSVIYFYPKDIKLDKKGMSIRGFSKYPFPHPVEGGQEAPMLTTEEGWVNFDRYKPYGELELTEEVTVNLLDPYGFSFLFAESSRIQLFYDEYALQLDGKILLNDKVQSVSGNRVGVPFRRTGQLYYMTEERIPMDGDLRIIRDTKTAFNSMNYVIDLSEDESPRKVGGKDWKGIYFNEFEMILHPDLDQNGQLLMDEALTEEVNQNASRSAKAWIDAQGLDFEWEQDLRGARIARFNTFPAKLDEVKISVENSALQEGYFEGSIVVLAIDPTRDIPFKVPADQNGFKPGYLTQSLDNSTFAFNPYGGENKVEVTIRRAVFENNDHLNLTADFVIPKFGIRLSGIRDFNLYGDHFIGFKKRNGATRVSGRPTGTYDGMKFALVEIGASLLRGSYVFSYNTEVNMGAGFDAPTLSFHSITPAEGAAENASVTSPVRPEIYVPKPPADQSPKELLVDDLRITYENNQIYFTAAVEIKKDHPDYGTHYVGELEGEIKVPARFALGGNLTYGSSPHEFFYMDAFFVDEQGTGINIYPNVNLVGFEGWVYKGMSVKKTPGEEEGKENAELVLDRSNDFGFNLFGQFIDQNTFGANFQMDGVLEYASNTGDITIGGDISMINTQVRDPSAMAGVASKVKQEVAQKAAKEALKAIGGIDETVTVEGVDVRFILDESSGSLGMSSGGYETRGTIDIAGTPAAQIDLSGKGMAVSMRGDVRDAAKATFTSSDLTAAIDYKPNSGGAFEMKSADFEVDAVVNTGAQSGDMIFKSGEITTRTQANMSTKEGSFSFDDGSRNFEIEAGLNEQQAGFAFDSGDGIILDVDANGRSKSGLANVTYAGRNGDVEVSAGFNQQQGKALFDFADNQLETHAEVEQSGKLVINNAFDGNTIDLEGDASEGGRMDVSIDGQEAAAWMNLEGMGGISFENSDYSVWAEGNQRTKAGKLRFEKEGLKIAGEADPAAQTGAIDLLIDGNAVKGQFSTEEQQLSIDAQGALLTALHNADSTGLALTQGSNTFAVGGEPAQKRGFVQLKEGENEIFVKADQNQNSGAFRLLYDGITARAQTSASLKSAYFERDDILLDGSITADSSYVHAVVQQNEVSAGLRGDGSNSIAGTIEDVAFAARTHPEAKTGSFRLQLPERKLSAALSPEGGNFEYAENALSFSAMMQTSGNGSLAFTRDELKVSIAGGKKAQRQEFEFNQAKDRVFVSLNQEERSGQLEVQMGEQGASASFNPQTQMAAVAMGQDSVRLEHLGEGAGKLDLAYGDLAIQADAVPQQGKGSLHFKNPDLTLDVDANMNAPEGSFKLEMPDLVASGAYTPVAQSFRARQSGDYIRMIKEGSSVNGAVKYAADSIAVVYQPQELSGRVNFAYGGHSINGDVNVKAYQAALAMDLKGFDCNFDVAIDRTHFNYTIPEGCDIDLDLGYNFELDMPAVGLDLGYVGFDLGTVPNVPLNFHLGEFDMAFDADYAVSIELPDFTMKLPAMGNLQRFTLDDLEGWQINGVAFDPNMPDVDMSNFDLEAGVGRIGLDRLAGFPLALDLSTSGLSMAFDGQVDLNWKTDGWQLKTPQVLGLDMDFGYDNSFDRLAFEIPDFSGFELTPGTIRIGDGSVNLFTISAETFEFGLQDFGLSLSPELAAFEVPGTFGLELSLKGVNLAMGDLMTAGFDLDQGLKLELPELNANLGADMGSLSFAGLSLNLIDGYKGLSLDLDGNELRFSPGELRFNFEDYALGLDTENINLQLGQDLAGIGFDGTLNASLADFELEAIPGTGFSFEAPGFGMGLNTDGLYSAIGGVQFDLGMDQTLTLSGLGAHTFGMSPVSFDYALEDLRLGYELGKKLDFSGFDVDVSLSPVEGVGIAYGDYGMQLGLNKDLDLNLGMDKTLSINPDLFDLSYGDISLGFGVDKNLWFDFDPYTFELTDAALSLGFEDMSLGIDADQTLKFVKGPDLSLSLSPELIDFSMPDYSLGFDTKVLSFSSPGWSFSTADMTIGIGSYDFGLTLLDDIPSVRLWEPDGLDISLNIDQLASLKFGGLDVQLSPELLFDFEYDQRLRLLGNYEMMQLGWDDYQVRLGLDTLVQFDLDPCRVMFLLQDPSGKIPGFQPGLYTVCDEYMVSANLGGLRFQQGIGTIKRSFAIDRSMQDFDYEEYEIDRFNGQLRLGDGYQYKLNYFRPQDKFGGGLGRVASNNDLHAEISMPDMGLIGLRTDEKNKIEGMINKSRKSVPGDLSDSFKNNLDGYFLYTGAFPADLRGKAFEDLLGVSLASESEEGENLEESPDIKTSGPKHIGTIADKAGGFLLGDFKLWQSGSKSIMTGNVAGKKLVEVKGAFDFRASTDTWSFKMGSRSQPINIKAGDYSQFDGYLWLNPDQLEIGFGASGSFKDSWSVEVVEVSLEAKYSVSTYFVGTLDPLGIDEAGVDASAYFSLDCEFCEPTGIGDALGVGSCTKEITLASVGFSGSLSGRISSGKVSGTLEGTASVFGVDLGTLETSASLDIK